MKQFLSLIVRDLSSGLCKSGSEEEPRSEFKTARGPGPVVRTGGVTGCWGAVGRPGA